MKILVVGHACGPAKGSEPGMTWNWAWELSRWHKVWVIAYPQFRAEVEEYLAEHPNPNLTFIWFSLSGFDPWVPERGQRGVRLHYVLWLRDAYQIAAKLHQRERFDVIHHVSLSTIAAATPFWRLDAAVIWGPLGGGQTAPPAFRGYFGTSWLGERLRTIRVRALPFSATLRNAVARCSLVLATNSETLDLLHRAGAERAALFLDIGMEEELLRGPAIEKTPREELRLVWIGRLEKTKGLPIALEALAAAQDVPARLTVIGEGSARTEWEELARKLRISNRVTFTGHQKRADLLETMDASDVFLFTSLRDSTGNVVFEALARSLPVVIPNHQGAGTFVPQDAGIKLPVEDPKQMVDAMAGAIRRLARNRGELEPMRRAAFQAAEAQTWRARGERMTKIYQEVSKWRAATRAHSAV